MDLQDRGAEVHSSVIQRNAAHMSIGDILYMEDAMYLLLFCYSFYPSYRDDSSIYNRSTIEPAIMHIIIQKREKFVGRIRCHHILKVSPSMLLRVSRTLALSLSSIRAELMIGRSPSESFCCNLPCFMLWVMKSICIPEIALNCERWASSNTAQHFVYDHLPLSESVRRNS